MGAGLYTFQALYDGLCGVCQKEIVAQHDEIVKVEGEYVHASCAEEEGYLLNDEDDQC